MPPSSFPFADGHSEGVTLVDEVFFVLDRVLHGGNLFEMSEGSGEECAGFAFGFETFSCGDDTKRKLLFGVCDYRGIGNRGPGNEGGEKPG